MESPPASPRMGRATLFGLAASVPIALVYGVLADPFGLSWGLIVVGLAGGFVIGAVVVQGAFNGRFHLIVPRVRWLAAIVALVCWVGAAFVAYLSSQLFYQGAATPLLDRLSVSRLVDYLNGTVFSPSILGLAVMAFMAWRGAK